MHRSRVRKKGHLIIEVVIYISLVGILMIPIMNVGLFIFKTYNFEKAKLENKITFIQVDDAIEKYIETPGTTAVIVETNKGVVISVQEKKNNKEIYNIAVVDEGLVVKNFEAGGEWSNTLSIDHNVESMDISQQENILYVEFVFKNGYKDVGVYEK